MDYEDVAYTQGVKAVTALYVPQSGMHFAPPVFRHGDVEISQMPSIVLYIVQKLDKLVPEDEPDKWRAFQLFLTAAE